jgi:cytochrome oxidase Cu insertion factor (SCO1/SenC/PrrC family)
MNNPTGSNLSNQPVAPGGPGRTLVIMATLMAVALVAMGFSLWQLTKGSAASSPQGGTLKLDSDNTAALASLEVPEFALLDQDGATRTRDLLLGKFTILAFTFTHCPLACPAMNSQMLVLQDRLKDTPVQLLSISVDPAHDTPARLKEHAAQIGADTSRWTFLTAAGAPEAAAAPAGQGPGATIDAIVQKLGFALHKDESQPIALPGGQTMSNIVHPTRLLLIGPDARVLAMDSGLEFAGAERLAARARALHTALSARRFTSGS